MLDTETVVVRDGVEETEDVDMVVGVALTGVEDIVKGRVVIEFWEVEEERF